MKSRKICSIILFITLLCITVWKDQVKYDIILGSKLYIIFRYIKKPVTCIFDKGMWISFRRPLFKGFIYVKQNRTDLTSLFSSTYNVIIHAIRILILNNTCIKSLNYFNLLKNIFLYVQNIIRNVIVAKLNYQLLNKCAIPFTVPKF